MTLGYIIFINIWKIAGKKKTQKIHDIIKAKT